MDDKHFSEIPSIEIAPTTMPEIPQQSTDSQNKESRAVGDTPQNLPPILSSKLSPKKKTTLVVSILAVGFLLLLGGGTYAYLQLRQTPEKRFDAAIQNHLETKYIGQKYTITYKTGESTVADTVSDFSSPAKPSTKGRVTLYDKKHVKMVDYEAINTGSYAEYGKYYLIDSSIETIKPIKYGQWLKADSLKYLEDRTIDPIFILHDINTTTGEFLVGNYSSSMREAIKSKISQSKPYTIETATKETLNGQTVFKYDLKIHGAALKTLNEYVIDKLKLPIPASSNNYNDESLIVWVNASSNRFIKAQQTTNGATSVVDLTYPQSVSIEIPQNAEALQY